MIWLLLVVYQIKHFVCDYPLQTPWMLGKFKGGTDWILPLAAHAGVHAVATILIACLALMFTGRGEGYAAMMLPVYLGLFDFAIHFAMDRIKASPNLLGRYKPLTASGMKEAMEMVASDNLMRQDYGKDLIKSNKYFWWALGLDQGVHHLTHYVIIYFIVTF
jgi:hypothetical protein